MIVAEFLGSKEANISALAPPPIIIVFLFIDNIIAKIDIH
jgi:hypothetical protein